MSVSKSDILKEISKSYPNLLKKDLLKFIDVFLDEIRTALKEGERVELRGWGVFFAKKQISRNSRNPKTGQIVFTPEKKSINYKMSKELFNKLNEKN